MAYGTAPHKNARGQWVTRDGRVLTPAGQAWWEHHHQQGYVTADGHTTQKARSAGFAAQIDPTRSILPAPPPPRAAPGQPTITRGQWKGMTPTQKMGTQVTVTLTPRERAALERKQDAQIEAARKRGQRVVRVPAIPGKVNVPIGFGGASGIDQRMAALDAAEAASRAAYAKAHPPQPSQLEMARAQATAQGQANFPEALAKVRAWNAAAGPSPLARAAGAVSGFGGAMVEGIGQELGLDRLSQDQWGEAGRMPSTGVLGGSPLPGISPQQIRAGGQALTGIGNLALGPNITSLLTGTGKVTPGGLGLDVGLLLPGTGFIAKPLRAARTARAAARAARASERAAEVAVDVASIPERVHLINLMEGAEIPESRIKSTLAFMDNQAALHRGGAAAFWRDRVNLRSADLATTLPPNHTLYQETPEARSAKTKAGAADAQAPANAYWRDRHKIPHSATRKDFVEGRAARIAARKAYIPDIVFAPEETRNNLIAKLFPQKGVPDGIPKTGDLWKRSASGDWFKLAGNVTKEDWVQRVLAVVKDPQLINELARWYRTLPRTFQQAFGDEADEMIRALGVSQANASPASGTTASMKVRDRLVAGDPLTKNEYSAVGLNIQKALRDEKIDKYVAAKLSDFIDSLANRNTRTWMGHDPRGGSPVAVDVHAIRDRGFIDDRLRARIEGNGWEKGKDFILEGDGTAEGALYERIAEWYHEITDHLNEIEFNGRSDWTPREAQALGWSAIQMAHDVIPEGAMEALARNTRTIGFEVTRGVGDLGADLSMAETRRVANAMLPHARALADDMDGLWVRSAKVRQGGWGDGSNIMIEVQVLGSEQAVQDALTHYAQAFDQGGVQAAREVTRDTAKAAVVIHSPLFKNPRTVARFWEELHKLSPVDTRATIKGPDGKKIPNPNKGEALLAGYMPWDEEGVPAIAIRTESPYVSPKTADKFLDKYEEAIVQASKNAGIAEPGYTARNIELLTGDQSGATNPLQTLPGGWDTRGRAATLAHPRSAGIRSDLESIIERVRAGERVEPARPAPPGGIDPGWTLLQRSPDPASKLPRGATEFLGGGRTRMHFFEGVDADTVLHELFHVSLPDLRGRHFLTLADEYAGGKPLHLWTDEEHEAAAAAFERWLATGKTTNPKLKNAFRAIQEWMLGLLGKAKDSGFVVPQDVEDAFNYMFRKPPKEKLEEQVVEAAKRAKTEVYPKQEIKRREERGARFARMEEARVEAGGGYAGQVAALEQLQGEYWKEPFDDLTHLDRDQMEYLIGAVGDVKRLTGIQKTSLVEALKKANAGEVLTPYDTKLVFKAFGSSGLERRGLTRTQKALDLLTQIVNIPRSFMSSFDVSGILRQGLMTTVMHPVMSAKLTPQMMRYLFSEKYYLERMARYRQDPRYDLLTREGGLELTDTGHEFGSEEAYQSQIAETMTGGKYGPIRASGRAYTGLLNDMRWGSATNMYDVALENNVLTGEELQRIGRVSNWATGRGTLGKHEQSAQLMNLFLFSPRLLSSRLQTFNPWFYKGLDPDQRLLFVKWSNRTPAQKQALKATSRLLLAGGSILALAKMAGADIELDPRSSDFGKIRVGNTRVDIWGGHQAIVRTFFQALDSSRKVTSTGELRQTNFLDPIFRFFESKASPPMSLGFDIHRGRTFTGDPVYWGDPRKAPWDQGSFWKPDTSALMGSRLWPLGLQDTWEAYGQADDAAVAALIYALSSVGFSTQTYPDETPKDSSPWDLGTQDTGGSEDDWTLPDTGDFSNDEQWALP